MTAPGKSTSLRPLLGSAIPQLSFPPAEAAVLAAAGDVIDAELAPAAGRVDEAGRYPDQGIAGLKRSGLLTAAIPECYGGLGASNRFSVEAQVRLGAADSSVAQVFKVHDELVREIFQYCPDGFGPRFARLLHDGAIIGLAVAENGRRVDAPPWPRAPPCEPPARSFSSWGPGQRRAATASTAGGATPGP